MRRTHSCNRLILNYRPNIRCVVSSLSSVLTDQDHDRHALHQEFLAFVYPRRVYWRDYFKVQYSPMQFYECWLARLTPINRALLELCWIRNHSLLQVEKKERLDSYDD